MKRYNIIDKILKRYKYSKARASFLKKFLSRFTLDIYVSIINSSVHMFDSDEGASRPLNLREQSAEYSCKCEESFRRSKSEIENELKILKSIIEMIDDAMEMLRGINEEYHL